MSDKTTLIIQSDLTILLDTGEQHAKEIQRLLQPFSELVKVMGQYEVYQITAVTLWNALTLGMKAERIFEVLKSYAKHGIPLAARQKLTLWSERFGRLTLQYKEQHLILYGDLDIMNELASKGLISDWIIGELSETEWSLKREGRGFIKQELAHAGYAVIDLVGYHDGEALAIELSTHTRKGDSFQLRDYQRKAIAAFHRDRLGGSGVIVLPCGTGKTITGIGVMASLQAATLIVTANVTSANQWKQELIDKTTIDPSQIGIYGGKERQVAKVTIATYTILTQRKASTDEFNHMNLFSKRDWGLIIYDEVQLLPAPIFRMTATIQATRRLGLTATLIREDGCASDVFSLVGPKLFDMQWKKAEQENFIAKVECTEIRVSLATEQQQVYAEATAATRLRIAAENPNKLHIIKQLLDLHRGRQTLIIGQYISQLKWIAAKLGVAIIHGSMSHQEREQLYNQFRKGTISVLVVSKIANLAVDLPDASVAIQVSGSFGSRQEEAQRIGRLLRPKLNGNQAWFYTIVTAQTKETEFALKRGLFMLEQGYQYRCITEQEVVVQ